MSRASGGRGAAHLSFTCMPKCLENCCLPSSSFLTHSTDGPDTSDEMNRPIRSDGKRCPNMFSQGNSSFFRKRHSIARSWPLPTQKRGPVIVEIAEDSGNVD